MKVKDQEYSSPRWSYEILDCAMPMTFDTYSNCAHQCVYCFAFFQRAVHPSGHDDYLSHVVKSVNVDRVKRMFLEPDKYAGQFAWYIKRRLVLQWGGLSDGFDWYEKKLRKSLDLLRFFKEIDYPVSISTKGTWFLDDPEYVEVLRDAKNTHWKYSIITSNRLHASKLEAGVVEPAKRFDALRRLKDLGVGATTLRFRPYVLGVSNLCAEEMIRMGAEAGVDSVTTEFLCLEKRANETAKERYEMISEICGFDAYKFYVENSFSGSGLMRLNYDIKRQYIKELQDLCAQYGLPFFVSDAHHKESSASAGCCGLPATGPLSNYNRGQFSEAMMIAKRTGSVRWSDISELAQDLNNIRFYEAKNFNQGDSLTRAKNFHQTMFDYMHNAWNDTKSWMSPARYFGGALVPSEADENGDVVYLYNKPFIETGERVKSVLELKSRIADSADALRVDGASMGHVAFPIFIPTRDRANSLSIAGVFDRERIPYTLVVEPQEEDAYRERFPASDILILPQNDAGLWYAREFILDYCRQMGYFWHWQFDDNIKGFAEGTQPATARAALSYAESLVSQYDNLAIVSFDHKQFAFRVKNPFTPNRRNASSLLIHTAPGADFRPEAYMKQDLDFQLQRLTQGYSTILVHRFGMDKPTMGSTKGGCQPLYKAGLHSEYARRLAALWPNTKLVEKDSGVDLRVDWKVYPNTLRPIVPGAKTPEEPERAGA